MEGKTSKLPKRANDKRKGKGKMKKLNISKLGVVVMTGVTLSAYANTPSQIVRDEVGAVYNAPKQVAIELGNSWLSDSDVKPLFLEAFTQELTKSVQLKTEAQIEKVPASGRPFV